MRNVFNLFATTKNEFTAREKTLLSDIAIAFRDQGICATLHINPVSTTPLAKFIDFNTNELYMFVTRHQDEGVARYELSPRMKASEAYINFADVLISCRNHIESFHRSAIDMQIYRRG